MRKISALQVAVFIFLAGLALGSAVSTTALLAGNVTLGDFSGIALTLVAIILGYIYLLLIYRSFLRLFPLEPGEIAQSSPQEFVYHVYLLFYLIFFYPLMRSGMVPVPVMRVFYLALGARLGANTYSSGIILDPLFVTMGGDCIVGQFALIVPHVIEGTRLAHYPVTVGNRVTIGAGSIVLSGVVIADDAIVSAGAVVSKQTQIGKGEVWGGVPAKRIGIKALSGSC